MSIKSSFKHFVKKSEQQNDAQIIKEKYAHFPQVGSIKSHKIIILHGENVFIANKHFAQIALNYPLSTSFLVIDHQNFPKCQL